MLEKLLNEIQRGGTQDVTTLAYRLETSPEMIRMMLEQLARMGRLTNSSYCAGDGCGGCSLSDSCGTSGDKINIWEYRGKVKS